MALAKKRIPQAGDRYRVIDENDVHFNRVGIVLSYEDWYYYPVHMEFDDGRKMAYRIEELELVETAKAAL